MVDVVSSDIMSSRRSHSRHRRRPVCIIIAFVAIAISISIFNVTYATIDVASSSSSIRLLFGPPDHPKFTSSAISHTKVESKANSNVRQAANNADVEDNDAPVAVIAHAISLIKCNKGSSVTGFLDAAAVLRHSIHKNSIHYAPPSSSNSTIVAPSSSSSSSAESSRYSYKMYGIVHTSCLEHAKILQRLGYTTLIRDQPVQKEDIYNEWLRNHIEAENCCGSAEFIKLYAYTLVDHPIVVHWDMDVAVLQPMDDLFDVMIYPKTHRRNIQARQRIERQQQQHPPNEKDDSWPEIVDAFLTRDITSAKPWEKVTAVQGGFLIARPNLTVFDSYISFIKEGNYIPGRGDGSGWGGLGYGGFQGAMAYQGVVAYYYDIIKPGTHVELNVCRWNQVAADVIWRGPERYTEHHLQCRDYPRTYLLLDDTTSGTTPSSSSSLLSLVPDYASNTYCEDCRNTPIHLVKSVHYTACKKPWECQLASPRVPRDKKQSYRLENLVNITMCMELVREWFVLRTEFEIALEVASHGNIRSTARSGTFEEQYFMGYCRNIGEYVAMNTPPDDFDITALYGM